MIVEVQGEVQFYLENRNKGQNHFLNVWENGMESHIIICLTDKELEDLKNALR